LEIQRDPFLNSVKMQSSNRSVLWYLHFQANDIPRTDSLVQVNCTRVVDLDIGASKSDSLRDQSITISECAGRTRAQPLVAQKRLWKMFLVKAPALA